MRTNGRTMVPALLLLLPSLAIPWIGEDPPAHSLSGLAWMVGSWEHRSGEMLIEEHWIPEAGKTMLGLNRTVVRGRTVAFEFLRLEERPEGIFYVAHPNARAGTDFRLTRLEENSAVFENPQHDNPKIIRYRRGEDGSLHARIEGDEKGRHVVMDFHFRPVMKE